MYLLQNSPQLLPPGCNIVDIGANVGDTTLPLAVASRGNCFCLFDWLFVCFFACLIVCLFAQTFVTQTCLSLLLQKVFVCLFSCFVVGLFDCLFMQTLITQPCPFAEVSFFDCLLVCLIICLCKKWWNTFASRWCFKNCFIVWLIHHLPISTIGIQKTFYRWHCRCFWDRALNSHTQVFSIQRWFTYFYST